MVHQSSSFGEELRRRRLAAGLTLSGLAQQVHYSKGQLSKVERGLKGPSLDLVRLCDAALAAAGRLTALAPRATSEAQVVISSSGGEGDWRMWLPPRDQSRGRPVSRRHMMAVGAAAIPIVGVSGAAVSAGSADMSSLSSFRSLFDHYRQLGQNIDARLLLPALIAQVGILSELSRNADLRTRRGLLILASRYAEYIGWLTQETGNERAALSWTQEAAELATAGGDGSLAAYAMVRHALVTLYRGDAAQTIELAGQAESAALPPRIRGLAAQREAQGYALTGDYDACMRSLDRARVLLARSAPDQAPVIGSANLADPAEMVRGWCLYDLGRPLAAAEVIGSQLACVPQQARRTHVRYGVRHALAYAAAGEVDRACQLMTDLLDTAVMLGSATVAADLFKVARTLARHPRNAAVRDLAPRLGTALRRAVP
jgi:transcriptional regulator with XRE-family HTH domain